MADAHNKPGTLRWALIVAVALASARRLPAASREGQRGRTVLGLLFAWVAAGSAVAANGLLADPASPPPAPPPPAEPAPPQSEAAGAAAGSPVQFSKATWQSILKRVWAANNAQNLSLMSAGVAFYAFLSFVPLLAALVMSYGLIADPAVVSRHMMRIIDLVPAEAAKLIYEQLIALTTAASGRKGVGLLLALGVSIFGASRASGAIISALNVIYDEDNRRGLVRGFFTSIALIIGAVLTGIVGVLAATMLGYANDLLASWGRLAVLAVQLLTWGVAGGLCCLAIGAMYRFAPNRAHARWRWLSVGSVTATILWLAATLGFGLYAGNFANYDVTYGSLSAVVVLLMWLYVSAYAILVGGLINAEAERQTAVDSTTGPPAPIGQRGATVADMSAALDAGGSA
ncbi:YihY/virulence factor BrkB family protein [Sandarakinorhabdus sp.]|uniref:YihY/virulence factor BrkB family protein n=1 Tax=Sandarakinorhabdus sp. TaxID=1916663 RepID=UPI003F6F8374